MQSKNVSSQELQKYVLGLVGIWILFVVSFPVAYLRVSRSEKYSGSPFKSLTWEEAQRPKKLAVVELASNDVVVEPASDVVKEAKTEATEGSTFIDYSKTSAEAESTLGVSSEIAANNALGQLTQQVYKKIDQAWQTWPTFTENLVYQVTVNEQGAIASYKPINKAADNYLSEIPLPSLIQVENDPSIPLAELTVIFTPNGLLEVNPSSSN